MCQSCVGFWILLLSWMSLSSFVLVRLQESILVRLECYIGLFVKVVSSPCSNCDTESWKMCLFQDHKWYRTSHAYFTSLHNFLIYRSGVADYIANWRTAPHFKIPFFKCPFSCWLQISDADDPPQFSTKLDSYHSGKGSWFLCIFRAAKKSD